MKKTLFNLLGVFLCGLTTQAAADYCSQNYNDYCEWSALDGKMTIGADWLFWNVQQDGISPGKIIVENVQDKTTKKDTQVPYTKTRGIHNDPKWSNGFRVYLGYELPCDCWDAYLTYTFMPSHDKNKDFKAKGTTGFGSTYHDREFEFFASKWDLSWHTLDLDLGRAVCLNDCLKLRPHVGLRATWFDQKFHSFGAIEAIGLAPRIAIFDALKLKQEFQGYGVEAGLWADYKLSCGLSLIGHFGGSILYSKFDVHNKDVMGMINLGDAPLNSKTNNHKNFVITDATIGKDTFYTATPILDYFIGLQYADHVCDMHFKIYAGWEQHVLFDTNRFLSSGNLSGQGLTLGLQVGF